ncbi:radical SAM protein [Amedibacillus dolichus]|uniref:Radical SAM protein n=1 Tax=Amedibacillus dolichus TaxID=31971 RepID=A0ABT7UBM2_9FIRM|nr:radical SAM protein [Amedibacillus dolichus]MDM8157023.1 radical SAM protein [Amedibacillus dolichus]
MKFSKFNITFDYNNKSYLTNTFSKSILEIDSRIKRIIENNISDALSKNEESLLGEHGFMVNESIDEIGLLRYRSNKLKNDKSEMEFVICPTLECNFSCTYCFESPRKGCMSQEIQDQVLQFIFEKVNDPDNKSVHIIWFGGEPLLYPDILLKMNDKLYQYCKENNKLFKSEIITNGYLLNVELVEKLIKCHIEHLQITLDGAKCSHDSRRILKNGDGTFDVIYKNLELLFNKPITVSLRMNVDKTNLENIADLEKSILKLNNPNIICHPAIVELSDMHFQDIKEKCFYDDSELQMYYGHPTISKYYNSYKCSDYGLRSFFCEAEHEHSFVIDEIGNVYKCWNSVGVDDEVYCTVKDTTPNPAIVSVFLGRDPFTEKKCVDCPYIPICAGGCVMQKKLRNENECCDNKFNFLESVKKSINMHKE